MSVLSSVRDENVFLKKKKKIIIIIIEIYELINIQYRGTLMNHIQFFNYIYMYINVN